MAAVASDRDWPGRRHDKLSIRSGPVMENMFESASVLIWGMVFAGIGLGFFLYGKKQKAVVPLVAGTGLFIFPYFISNVYLLVFIGCLLIALPCFVRT